MSINKLISIKEAILEASENMGFDLTRDKPTFAMWAVQAEKDIGSYYSYKRKRAVLDIVNCRAKLPCNAAYLKLAVMGDLGVDCSELMGQCSVFGSGLNVSSNETFFIIDKPEDSSFCMSGIRYEIQNNEIVFSSNPTTTKVTIEYLGLEEDCDGFVMVNENHKPAITEYIMWKFCVRSRFSPIKMELGDIQMHKQEYFRLAMDARAMDAQMTESERREVVAMLHDPFSGYGLDIGITNEYLY